MKRYRLLKDTPTIKAGTIFEEVVSDFDKLKELVRITPLGAKTSPQWTIQDINNFDEWFEKVEEADWKPKKGDEYWTVYEEGSISKSTWNDDCVDKGRYRMGNCHRTEDDAKHAKEVQIARTKIEQSSDFKPDWNDDNQEKWYVAYDHSEECLCVERCFVLNNGAIVYYKTIEDTEQAMEDLEPDYLLHFGVEE